MRSACMTSSAMYGSGPRTVGMNAMRGHRWTAPLGRLGIVRHASQGEVAGAMLPRRCDRRTEAGIVLVTGTPTAASGSRGVSRRAVRLALGVAEGEHGIPLAGSERLEKRKCFRLDLVPIPETVDWTIGLIQIGL